MIAVKSFVVRPRRRLAIEAPLVVFFSLTLSACSAIAPWSLSESIVFSHSQPSHQARSDVGNNWSPTQWPAQKVPTALTAPAPIEVKDQLGQPAATASEALTVFFDTDSDTLSAIEVEKLFTFLKSESKWSGLFITVRGHTDSRHTSAYNLALSERRARRVAQWFDLHGVPSKAILVEAFGLTAPQGSNETAHGRAQNRRVEVLVRREGVAR